MNRKISTSVINMKRGASLRAFCNSATRFAPKDNRPEDTITGDHGRARASDDVVTDRIPPSWLHGKLATPRADRVKLDPMRDRFARDHIEDIDGPMNSTRVSENLRRPPERALNENSEFKKTGPQGIPANTEHYNSRASAADEDYFEKSGTIGNKASDMFREKGRKSTSQRMQYGTSKMRQYGQRGYDWLEHIAKKSPHTNARELKNNMIIIAFAIGGTVAFLYWCFAYKTVVLTTDAHRKQLTRLPPLPSDLAYFQCKWPWSLFVFPWSKPSRSLLVVGEMDHKANFDVTSNPLAIAPTPPEDNSASVSINPLFVSSRLYRSPRDFVVQIHKDPITGQNTEERITYNRLLYRCIPYLFQQELPVSIDLRQFANPRLFQKELISAENLRQEEEVERKTQHAGLPNAYPATKRPAVPKQQVESEGASSKFPPMSHLYLKFQIRHKRDFPNESGSAPFVNSAIESSVQAVFQKYYYHTVLQKHNMTNDKNSVLVKRMVHTGVLNGETVEMKDIFSNGRASTFIADVLNEVVLRIGDKAIIVEKSAALI